MNNLYDTDYPKWIEKQKQLLLSKNFNDLDIENLVEELEEMGESDYNALESHLENLILHLLKYNYQKSILNDRWIEENVLHFWITSVTNSRTKVNRTLKKKPSLKNRINEAMEKSYEYAKLSSIKEMNDYSRNENQKLNDKSFPDICPWSFDQILVEDWLPKEKL